MKKILCLVLVLLVITCAACTSEPSTDYSNDTSEHISAESSLPEHSADSTEEESSTAAPSEEESEEQSVEIPPLTTEQITAQIAAINSSGFTSNIDDCEQLKALSDYLNGSGYGFFYCDLEYSHYAAYGCDKVFKTASTAKLPYVKYLFTLADKGEININDTMLFEARHKTSGSGIMKNLASGVNYKIATLMDYTLRYSDNVAYSMLIEKYGQKGYLEYVKTLGVSYTTGASGYTNCTASTMAALLFDTAVYEGEGLALMLDAGCNASYNRQIGAELKEHKVLQKYGAMKPGNVAYHDIAVVYAPHPYIIVIFTTIDYDSVGKDAPFRTIARLTDNLNNALHSTAE